MSSKSKDFKPNTLQRYGADGYLDLGGKYSAIDRISAGSQLYVDCYLGGVNRVGAIDPERIRVDGGGSAEQSTKCMFHFDRYQKAMLSVPLEFRAVVRRVCIEDKPIKASGTALDVKRKLYAARVDLCRGLDRLVDFYFRKKNT